MRRRGENLFFPYHACKKLRRKKYRWLWKIFAKNIGSAYKAPTYFHSPSTYIGTHLDSSLSFPPFGRDRRVH